MKPVISDFIKRFAEYYKKNPAWGSLHIVVEDGNVKDKDVNFCYKWALKNNDVDGMALAKVLLEMSKTQRLCIGSKVDKYLLIDHLNHKWGGADYK